MGRSATSQPSSEPSPLYEAVTHALGQAMVTVTHAPQEQRALGWDQRVPSESCAAVSLLRKRGLYVILLVHS